MIYSQICVNFRILGKNGDERKSWNAQTLSQTCLTQKSPKGSRPSEPTLA